MPPTWTILSLLRTTAAFLGERGSPSPRVDAEVLLAHVLGLDRMALYTAHDRPLAPDELDGYRDLVRRRTEGTPVAYLTGRRGFWTLDLRVDPRVLIPRPETEQLVEEALRFVGPHRNAPWRIVDVGTGSGALALALASELPRARVLGIDSEADALHVARANLDSLPDPERVRFVRGDLLAPLAEHPRRPHLIVSNPPYIAHGDPRIARDVDAHEPHAALYAGSDGLDVIRRLLPEAAARIGPGGLLLVEFGAGQGDDVRALAAPLFAEARILRDPAGHDRVLRAVAHGTLDLEAGTTPPPADHPDDPNTPAAPEPESSPESGEHDGDDPLQAAAGAETRLPVVDLRDL